MKPIQQPSNFKTNVSEHIGVIKVMPDINNISQLKDLPNNTGKAPLNLDLLDEFNSVFKEATAAMANVDNELKKKN